MAQGWKRTAEVLIARSRVAATWERSRRPSTVILAYHNIVPQGERVAGDASLHIDQNDFADQLDFILEGRRIVSLDEACGPHDGAPPATRVAITFDDAYVGTMTAGAEELTKRGLSATVFVPPGLLGAEGMWWDLLAPPGGRPLDDGVRAHALGPLQGKADRILPWARSERLPIQALPEHSRPSPADRLGPGRVPPGLTLGAHTWSHPNLVTLPEDELTGELDRSRAWLTANTDRYVDWLAYPYGEWNDSVARAASALFDGALLVSGGSAEERGRVRAARHVTPRVNVPRGLSLEGLALRLGGLA